MKNILKLLIVFVIGIIIYIPNVKADDCALHGVSDCTKYTYGSDKKHCVVKSVGESGKGTSPCCTTQDGYCSGKTAVDSDGYENYEVNSDVTCGNGLTFNKSIANVVYYFVLAFQIFGPVALIIWGMIDLFKGVVSNKDDKIKEGQATFVKRLITALIMFLVITIVRFLINILSTDTILDCFNCFVNGARSCSKQ